MQIFFFFLSKKARYLIIFPAEESQNTEQKQSRSFEVKYLVYMNTTESIFDETRNVHHKSEHLFLASNWIISVYLTQIFVIQKLCVILYALNLYHPKYQKIKVHNYFEVTSFSYNI